MNQEITGTTLKKSRVWVWIIVAVVVIIGVVFVFLRSDEDTWIKDAAGNWIKHGNPTKESPGSSTPVTISDKVLANKFGWLGGGMDDTGEGIIARGGLWVRPHPGAFVWNVMQKSKDDTIDFTLSDQEVDNFQKNNIGILATIWPFADWDQKNLANAADCKIADIDEFLPTNDKKGRGVYLPYYRCNPSDWVAYQKYVEAIVERYDGDGVNDMPGLKTPIKYWEAMNEPDLQYNNKNLPSGESDRLNFYKQGPADYGQLLKYTYQAIKKADPEANVLIAGAAGGSDQHLGFYDQLFSTMTDAANYFDIGNIHCISNDEKTSDFNVGPYKALLAKYSITGKSIWVTEAEAVYSTSAEENFQSTKKSTQGAIAAGVERIFFTRDDFGDTRTDMSKMNAGSEYPSAEKYQELIEGLLEQ